jgi:hypothetical protein
MKTYTAIKIARFRNAFILGVLLIASLPGLTQGSTKTDLTIMSIIIGSDIAKKEGSSSDANLSFGNLKCTITVHNKDGGLASPVMLVVSLPREITIVSSSHTYTPYYSAGNRGWAGSLLFDLQGIGTGAGSMIEFTFTRSAHANTVAAYVFSGSTDPVPANNFKEVTY